MGRLASRRDSPSTVELTGGVGGLVADLARLGSTVRGDPTGRAGGPANFTLYANPIGSGLDTSSVLVESARSCGCTPNVLKSWGEVDFASLFALHLAREGAHRLLDNLVESSSVRQLVPSLDPINGPIALGSAGANIGANAFAYCVPIFPHGPQRAADSAQPPLLGVLRGGPVLRLSEQKLRCLDDFVDMERN